MSPRPETGKPETPPPIPGDADPAAMTRRLTERERAIVRRAISARGVTAVAAEAGLTSEAVTGAGAGVRTHAGTSCAIRLGIQRAR